MFTAMVLIAIGLAALVVGGEVLLRGAVSLATHLRLTPAVIGLTVVAAGTSVPELAVSLLAALRNSPDIAVGNVVGSNIFNIAFTLGLAALVAPLAISGNTIKLEYPVMAIATLMCVALCQDGTINMVDGFLLLSVYVGFTAYMVSLVRDQMNEVEVQEFKDSVGEITQADGGPASARKSLFLVGGGIALLGAGAHATVAGAVDLALLFGLSERVIGLTIVAIGTGLPEAVTSIISSYRGRDDVAIGNIIGSNLFNILVILGLNSLVSPIPVAGAIISSDNWWMLGVAMLLFPILHTQRRISRVEGGLLLVVYLVYLGVLLGRT